MVPAQAEKVTVGLASHWPCVTYTVVYPPTGSTVRDGEISTHAYDHSGHGTIYLYLRLTVRVKVRIRVRMEQKTLPAVPAGQVE